MPNEAFSKLILTKSLQNTSRGRSSSSQMIFKIDALRDFAVFTENTFEGRSLFLVTLQAGRSATLLERDSNAGIFLRILRNF